MTLAQLQSFVLVARHGSVKAAAAELEVTEPAVSVAVAALRRELGDELFVREGRGIALTPGGRRLAALASEILGLAEQARRSVHDSPGAARRMQVVATSLVAEHVAPLIEAFTARDEGLEIAVEAVPGRRVRRPARAPPRGHRARPAPRARALGTIASAPFLRCRLIIVAAPGHPLAGRARRSRRPRSPASAGSSAQPDLDPTTGDRAVPRAQRPRAAPTSRRTRSQAAAIAAAAAGEGIVLTLAHSVVDEVRRRALVRLDVRGTPVVELWHASTLGLGPGAAGGAGAAALRDDARTRRRRSRPAAPARSRRACARRCT